MKYEYVAGTIGTSLSVAGTIAQTNEVLQMISIIITIVGAFVSFVLVPILNWYRNAKADGKITKEEIEEGAKIIADGAQEIADKTKGGIKGSQIEDEDKRKEIEKDSGKGI